MKSGVTPNARIRKRFSEESENGFSEAIVSNPTIATYRAERASRADVKANPSLVWNCKEVDADCERLKRPSDEMVVDSLPDKRVIGFEGGGEKRYIEDGEMARQLDEGLLVSVRSDGSREIDWPLMLLRSGVRTFDILPIKGSPASRVPLREIARIAYLAISGRQLTRADIAAFGGDQVKGVVELCQDKGVFLEEVNATMSALLAKSSRDEDYEKLRCILSLSRKSRSMKGTWPFDKEAFLGALSHLEPAYGEALLDIAKNVQSLCCSGKRPTIMTKAPDGCPVKEIAVALADALSNNTGCNYIDGSSITSALDLIGVNGSYQAANMGRIARMLYTESARAFVVGGVDHLVDLGKKDGDSVGFLCQCVSDGSYPTDSFLTVPMNLDMIPFVFTEKSDAITELDGYCSAVLSIKKLSRHEKTAATAELLHHYGLAITKEDAEFLVDRYAYDDGIVMLTKAVETIVEAFDRDAVLVDAGFIAKTLPEPNSEDPRYWMAVKRRLLDDAGGQCLPLAERLLADALSKSDGSAARGKAERRLKMLLGSVPNGDRIHVPDRDSFYAHLQATHPGITERDLKSLIGAVFSSVRNVRHPRPILLVGPAGTGKTTIISSIAAGLGGLHVVKKDMPAMSTSELFGAAGNMPSVLTESIALYDGEPGILHLDECDKMTSGLCSSQSLCSLLDEGLINDCYLNITCDYSKWLVILTANDLSEVSPYVLDRSQVVRLEGYPPSSKVSIARQVLIERKCSELGVKVPHFDDDALLYLASLDDVAGLRQFENHLELVVSEVEKSRISLADVSELIPRETHQIQGIAMIMARGGAKGGAALDSVIAVKAGKGVRATSLISNAAFDNALNIAASALLVGTGLDTSGIKVALEEVDDMNHAKATHGALSIAIALWFATNGIDAVCPSVAFVGELGLTGNVKPLDAESIPKAMFMVACAAAHGIDAVVCPGNLAEAPGVQEYAESMGVSLVKVDHVGDAIEYAKGRHCIASVIAEFEAIDFKL